MEYNKYENIEVLYDIKNMPEIMSSCDIGITSRGRTGYELAILGIPTISMAQNAREDREDKQKQLLTHDLRKGRKRVLNLINSLYGGKYEKTIYYS